MLKIAPIPDAAYEICTVFATDCRNHTRHRFGQSGYSNARNYGPVVHTTSSTYHGGTTGIDASQIVQSSNYAGEALSTSRSYYETKYNNRNSSRSYGRTSAISGLNASYNEQDENLVKETEEDYGAGSEDGNENVSVEDNDDYNLSYRPVNATYESRPTVETLLYNHSTVS